MKITKKRTLLATLILGFNLQAFTAEKQNSKVQTAQQNFGLNFMNEITKSEMEKNVFFSPLSASLALDMLWNGTAGETQENLKEAFHYQDLEMDEVNRANKSLVLDLQNKAQEYKKYIERAEISGDALELSINNSLWSDQSFPLKDSYISTMKDMYNAFMSSVGFSTSPAITAKIINNWASESTRGKIPEIVTEDELKGLVLLLSNATYFKGSWRNQFEKELTKKDDFYINIKNSISVDMMSLREDLAYTETVKLQAVQLPYVGNFASMTLILPKGGETLQSLSQELYSTAFWKSLDESLTTYNVNLKLPKFSFKYSKKLNDELKELGLAEIFGAPDFSNISDYASKLQVSFVKQDTFIKLDEEGTEAAAVTSAGTRIVSIPKDYEKVNMKINRPFFIAIQDDESKAFLFLGTIYSPENN